MRRLTPVLAVFTLLVPIGPLAQASRGVETFDAAWAVVRDSHFDPEMNGVDWDALRAELRPRAAGAATDGELRAVLRDMLARLGQSHFAVIPSTADAPGDAARDFSGSPGFDVRFLGPAVVVTRVDPKGEAASAGVRAGWVVTSIDGTRVADLLQRVSEALPERLRTVELWRVIVSRLRGPLGSAVTLTFRDHGDGEVILTVPRRAEPGQPATVGNLPTMHVQVESEKLQTPKGHAAGVIRFNVWMPVVDALFQQAIDRFRGVDGVVIDLRGNPGGLAAMLMGISGHFLAERKPLGLMRTRDGELKFAANPRLVSAAGERVDPYGGPVAILVDQLSGSASECFAGGMQSLRRARVFGQTTMGQALPALFHRLPNGDVLIHAYGDFVTADGTRLEGRGVIPDEEVPLRRADLLAGRDGALERALAWIDKAR